MLFISHIYYNSIVSIGIFLFRYAVLKKVMMKKGCHYSSHELHYELSFLLGLTGADPASSFCIGRDGIEDHST